MPTLADQLYFLAYLLALIGLIILVILWLPRLLTAVGAAFGFMVISKSPWPVDVSVRTGGAKDLAYRLGKAHPHQNGFARAEDVFAVMQIASTTLRPAPSAR